jgi:hypothetical protein
MNRRDDRANRADDRARARRPWILRTVLLNPVVAGWSLLISTVLFLSSFALPSSLESIALSLFAAGAVVVLACAVSTGCDAYGSARRRSTGVAGSVWVGVKHTGQMVGFWMP